jgi:hypothetical protein
VEAGHRGHDRVMLTGIGGRYVRYRDLTPFSRDDFGVCGRRWLPGPRPRQETRAQITIGPNEAMTKVMKLEDVQKQIKGPFTPHRVRGLVARARDTDQLRTPSQMRDGLALDDSAAIAAGGTPRPPSRPTAHTPTR